MATRTGKEKGRKKEHTVWNVYIDEAEKAICKVYIVIALFLIEVVGYTSN